MWKCGKWPGVLLAVILLISFFGCESAEREAARKKMEAAEKIVDKKMQAAQAASQNPPVSAITPAQPSTTKLTQWAKEGKSSAGHKKGMCKMICRKIDLLLYDDPVRHGKTATCSYSDDYLLIKPKSELGKDSMARFKFLAFSAVGFEFNEDYMMPEKVYVGYGDDCQVLTAAVAAKVQSAAKYNGDMGMSSAMATVAGAPKTRCPK